MLRPGWKLTRNLNKISKEGFKDRPHLEARGEEAWQKVRRL